MKTLELRIALRYMRSRRGSKLLSLISLIAVSGLIVGVSALVVIIGVMNGMQNDYREKILTGSPDIRVLPFGGDLVMYDWEPVMAKVRGVEGVVSVAPFVQVIAMVRRPHQRFLDVAQVVGLVADTGTAAVTSIRSTIMSGTFDFRGGGPGTGAVIGRRLADRLGVTPGIDSIVLVTTNLTSIDPNLGYPQPLHEQFVVAGIFDTGMFQYDDSYIYISLEAAQDLVQLGGAVTGLEVRTRSRDAAVRVADRIRDTVGIAARVEDWQEQNATLFSALKLEKVGMTFILTLIILVAAFNIVGMLTMVVHDKTREIGILRAMGIPARSVRRIFFTQGMVIGVVGTALGVAIGLFVSYLIDEHKLISLPPDVYFIDHLPAATEPRDVLLIAVGSMIIAAIATLRPARQAARLLPVDAIRHE